MPDSAAEATPTLFERFAALVSMLVERPSEVMEQRDLAKAIIEQAKVAPLAMALVDGALRVDGAAVESPLLAGRFKAYGIEELGITAKVMQADLLDLARLLAAVPGDGDPVARFAARATVLDRQALPRKLRERVPTPPPQPVVEAAPASLPPASPPAALRHSTKPTIEPSSAPPEPRDAPVRLAKALAVPAPRHPALAGAIDAVETAAGIKELRAALEQFVAYCDLAFRQGRHDDLIEGVFALIAVEYSQLEKDGGDERRQAFNHSIRRLARPVLLRQLATLRHARAADPVVAEQVQQELYRFGIDAAEAMLDETHAAPSPAARAVCIASLRGLPRAFEALRVLVKDANELTVRQAVSVLGALGDAQSEAVLDALLEHPEPRVRREVVSAFARIPGEGSWESLAFALGDESAAVRVRAVSAMGARRDPRLLTLLDSVLKQESDREVLFTAVDAIGRLGSPEAVQALIAIAQGQGTNPQRESAALRIQACIALVAIRTPQAMAAVQVLRDDRDREVRQASMRLVAHARRRPTTSQIAIVAE